MKKPRLVILYLISTIISLLVFGCLGILWLQNENQHESVYQMAQSLGLDPEAEISQANYCWDIFSHCGIFLYYQTDRTQEEVAQKLSELNWTRQGEFKVAGSDIFNQINDHTEERLTINGVDPTLNPDLIPLFEAHSWSLSDPKGHYLIVKYFPITAQQGTIALNGHPLEQNIIAILRQTR